jgi:hypothetical protein
LALVAVATGQDKNPTVLDRVQQVDDPELGELIRAAMASREKLSPEEKLQIVRKVTLSYSQIKLLDRQIEEVSRKLQVAGGPADMRYELLLARTELETKLMMELATLREAMGIVPRFPFEQQAIGDLNTWLNLQVLDQRVVVYDTLKPFRDYWAMGRHEVAGLLSEQATLDYIRGRLKDKKNLPVRIDIGYRSDTRSAGERLRDAVFSLAKETGTDMDVEVRLELIWWVTSTVEAPFFCREGKIRTLYSAPAARPDGDPTLFRTGLVDPNDLDQHILWRLSNPGNVPIRLRIAYDQVSAAMAKQVVEAIRTKGQDLGLGDLVKVAAVLVEPVPETAFLGRWEALGKGYFQAVDIQPQGVCQVTMGDGTETTQAGASVKGTWMPTCKEVLVDINDRALSGGEYQYLAFINQKGNLVVDRAEIYIQGHFHVHDSGQMIFQKVK